MLAGHGLKDAPESGHAWFGGVLFARQDFDAKAETQVGDKITVIIVAGASAFLRVVADLCAFLVAVERLHGVVDVKDPRQEEDGRDGLAVLLFQPRQGGGFVHFFEGTAHHIFADNVAHAQ